MKAAELCSIAVSLFLLTTAARTQTRPAEPAATLIELWADANGRCRGGSGDSAIQMQRAPRENVSEKD